MAVVDDELYITSMELVFSAVVNALASDVSQYDLSLEDLLQVGGAIDSCSCFVDSFSHLFIFLRLVGVSSRPLGAPSKYSNNLCATQFRLPSRNIWHYSRYGLNPITLMLPVN